MKAIHRDIGEKFGNRHENFIVEVVQAYGTKMFLDVEYSCLYHEIDDYKFIKIL